MKNKTGYRIIQAIGILAAAALCFGAVRLARTIRRYRAGREAYDAIAEAVIRPQEPLESKEKGGETPSLGEGKDPAYGIPREEKMPAETKREEASGPAADTGGESGTVTVDFEALGQISSNAVGWISCPGTVISYPVMQSLDNEDYLTHMPDGTFSYGGSIFIDARCDGLNGCNTVIYGHYQQDGSMFSSLHRYRSQSYYESHPSFFYTAEGSSYELQVIAAMTVASDDACYTVNMTEEEMKAFVTDAISRSSITTPFTSADGIGKIVTLSTCAYNFDGARQVVICKVVSAQ